MTIDEPTAATTVTTRSGERLVVRPLRREDDAAFVDAFEDADPDDLRKRFLGTPPAATMLLRYLHHADGDRDLVLGAFRRDGRLVAVVQLDRCIDDVTAELAIEVATDYQRTGLGTALLADLEHRARLLGITRLTASYYADNLAIRRLLADTGQVVFRECESGVTAAVLDIAAAS